MVTVFIPSQETPGSENIILDHEIKTHDCWVAEVDFLCETNNERTVSATAPHKKSMNNLHIELRHHSKTITHATARALGIQVTSAFKPCEDSLWVMPSNTP